MFSNLFLNQKNINKIILGIFISFVLFLPKNIFASQVYLNPIQNNFSVGDTLRAKIMIDSGGVNIKQAKIKINYPIDLLEVKYFIYGDKWAPVKELISNLIDNVNGFLIKEANRTETVSQLNNFGIIVFKIKALGEINFSVNSESILFDENNLNIFVPEVIIPEVIEEVVVVDPIVDDQTLEWFDSEIKKADVFSDGIVDLLDFNMMMVEWEKEGISNKADINQDGIVDVLDFNLLMKYWGEVIEENIEEITLTTTEIINEDISSEVENIEEVVNSEEVIVQSEMNEIIETQIESATENEENIIEETEEKDNTNLGAWAILAGYNFYYFILSILISLEILLLIYFYLKYFYKDKK